MVRGWLVGCWLIVLEEGVFGKARAGGFEEGVLHHSAAGAIEKVLRDVPVCSGGQPLVDEQSHNQCSNSNNDATYSSSSNGNRPWLQVPLFRGACAVIASANLAYVIHFVGVWLVVAATKAARPISVTHPANIIGDVGIRDIIASHAGIISVAYATPVILSTRIDHTIAPNTGIVSIAHSTLVNDFPTVGDSITAEASIWHVILYIGADSTGICFYAGVRQTVAP